MFIKHNHAAEPWRLIPSVHDQVVQLGTHQNMVPEVYTPLPKPLSLHLQHLCLIAEGGEPGAKAQPHRGGVGDVGPRH